MVWAARPLPHVGCASSNSGRAAATSITGDVPQMPREVFEESNLAAFCPMDVLEDEDRRLHEADALEEAPRGEEQQLRIRDVVVRCKTEEKREIAERFRRLGFRHELLDPELQLLARCRRRVRLEDSDRRVHKARECLVPGLLLIGEAAASKDATAVGRDEYGELVAEPRLPNARRPENGDQVRPALGQAPRPDRPDELELVRAPDECTLGERPVRRRDQGLDGQPRLDRLGLSLYDERSHGLVPNRVPRRSICLAADEEATRRRGGLEPRRRVHDVAGSQHVGARGIHGDDRVAGVHRCARGEVERLFPVQLVDPLEDTKARANRALGVLAVRNRGAEYAHHGIADELLDDTAVVLDSPLGLRVVELENFTHVFGIRAIRARGEADKVHEEDGHELPLFTDRVRVLESRPAARAEP